MKPSSVSHHAMLMLVINGVIALHDTPIICMSTPAIMVEAGSTVTATIDNPQARSCAATITFSNPDFLPIQFGFEALKCPGLQQAEFTIPLEAPNGDASISWQCAGQMSPTCSHALITQGQENPDLIVLDQYGTIGCLIPTATLTTLSTSTDASTTIINTLVSTYFSTSLSSSPSPSSVPGATTSSSLSSVPGATMSSSLSSVPGATTSSSLSSAPGATTPSSGVTTPIVPITTTSSSSSLSITATPSSSSSSSSVTLFSSTASYTTLLTLIQSVTTSINSAPF